MKKLMKACTLSLAALGALTFFQTEGAHAAAQPKEPVIAKAPIMNKVITVNRTLTVGSSIAVSLPASQISVSGATYAIQLDQLTILLFVKRFFSYEKAMTICSSPFCVFTFKLLTSACQSISIMLTFNKNKFTY